MTWIFKATDKVQPPHDCNPPRLRPDSHFRSAAAGTVGDIWKCDDSRCGLLWEIVPGFPNNFPDWKAARSLWARRRLNRRMEQMRRDGII